MNDWIVISKTDAVTSRSLVRELRQAGIDAAVLDDPGPILMYASAGTYKVRVAVAPEQKDEALQVLASLEQQGEKRTAELKRGIDRQMLQVGLMIVGVAAALVLWFEDVRILAWILLALVVIMNLLVMAKGTKRRE